MVGSAIVRELKRTGDPQLILRNREALDLCNQAAVADFFQREKLDQVYVAAAKVGGIHANNTYPAEFIYQNLMMEANIIHQAFLAGVQKLLFLGSSCIYPKKVPQPMAEDALLTGKLEPTNEPYAIAKIAGIKLCESYNRQYGKTHGIDYRSVMPTNLYGPGDNYHPENSHVIPALIRRFHEAKEQSAPAVTVWGTGKPKREFLHVDDLARACVHLMNLEQSILDAHLTPMNSHINIGSGEEITIADLAHIIAKTIDYRGSIHFDATKPDGTLRKFLDVSLARKLGWEAKIPLDQGLRETYQAFLSHQRA